MNKTLIVAIVSIALLGLIPNTLAHGGSNAGLSGMCYDAGPSDEEPATEGGEDELRVHQDGDVEALPGTTGDDDLTDNKGGAVPALVLFATESVNDGGQTGNACKRYDCFNTSGCGTKDFRYDYLEVGATVGTISAQACYNGGADISGGCPRSPPGEGN